MYLPFSLACTEPNSTTPMSAGRIVAQNARVARVGRSFTAGNHALDSIMSLLTAPVARPSCSDLLSSAGLRNASPFPEPGGGPAPTVESLSNPAAMLAFLTAARPAPPTGPGNGNNGWDKWDGGGVRCVGNPLAIAIGDQEAEVAAGGSSSPVAAADSSRTRFWFFAGLAAVGLGVAVMVSDGKG